MDTDHPGMSDEWNVQDSLVQSSRHLHQSFFYWQRILRNEAYIEQKQVPAAGESKPDLPVAFVELKPASGEKP